MTNKFMQFAQKQLDNLDGKNNDYKDLFVPMPPGDSGFVLIRLLPAEDGDDYPWVATRIHKVNERNIHCPREEQPDGYWRGDCPLCTYYSDTWNTSKLAKTEKESEDIKNYARSIKPYERYYFNAIVRQYTNPQTGESFTNLDPRVYSVGKKQFKKILENIVGDPSIMKEPLGDVTDWLKGYDLKVVKTTVVSDRGKFANYEKSEFAKDSTVAGTDEEIAKWKGILRDLKSFRKVLDIETIEKHVRVLKGEDSFEESSTNYNAPTPEAAPVREPVKEEAAPWEEEKKVESKPADPVVASVVDKISTSVDDGSMEDVDLSMVGDDFMNEIDDIINN